MKLREPTADLAGLIAARMAEAGVNKTALARRAGLNQHGVSDILDGTVKSPRLETLDKIAVALGYDSFVHLATAHPAIDEPVLCEAIEMTLQFAQGGQAWPPQLVAGAAVDIYKALTDPTRDAPPAPLELAMRVVQKYGPKTAGAAADARQPVAKAGKPFPR